MIIIKNSILVIFLMFCLVGQTSGQVYTNKVVGEKNEALKDSIIAKPYPYLLANMGRKS